jgi:hypothetical protein
MTEILVRKVEGKQDYKAFFEFPWLLYKNDPHWVPPLLSARRHLLDKHENPSWAYMEGDYFVAWRAGQPVGTIAAFINQRHNETWGERIAWFGCLEFYDDPAILTALLEAAIAYARSKQATMLRGPASFTLNDECGMLIEGFEQPLLLMPYNPQYYPHRMEASPHGFEKAMDTVSFWTQPSYYLDESGHLPEKLVRVVTKTKSRKGILTRMANPKKLRDELALLRKVYQSAWEQNWGFVPPTDREMDALFKSLRDYFHPSLGWFAEIDGQVAGFMLGLPDMNQVLKHAYPQPGHPEIWTLLKALWHWKIRPKITRQRVLLFGVVPEHRGVGADAAVYLAYIQESMNTIPNIDAGWVLESNQATINQAKMFNAKVHRRYRFYQKALG